MQRKSVMSLYVKIKKYIIYYDFNVIGFLSLKNVKPV